MEIDLSKYYYKEKFQGERVKRNDIDPKIWELHASHISHCITKSCYYLYCNEHGIEIPFDYKSINNMESGKALHLLHQEIDKELSKLKDNKFGWYPWYDDRWGDRQVDEKDFIEVSNLSVFKDILYIIGTYDQEMMDNKGLFLQELKSTGGYKWIDQPRTNHEVQLHVYFYLRERGANHLNIIAKEDEAWKNVVKDPIRRGRLKYIDKFRPLMTKVYDVKYNEGHIDFIYEQMNAFHDFVIDFDEKKEKYKKIEQWNFPQPNYVYLANWECNPNYCPFSTKEVCPLDVPCKYSQWG